jgi:hypothetical protein
VADGTSRGLGVFTGQRHDLDEALRGEGGGSPRAGFIGEDRLDEPEELALGSALGLGRFEGLGAREPASTPGADGLAMAVKLASDLIIVSAVGGQGDNVETAEQLLGTGVAAHQEIQELPLRQGKTKGKRDGARHGVSSKDDEPARDPAVPGPSISHPTPH